MNDRTTHAEQGKSGILQGDLPLVERSQPDVYRHAGNSSDVAADAARKGKDAMRQTLVIRLVLVLMGITFLAHVAVATGGSRNEARFTQHASIDQRAATTATTAITDVRGEPKNELPFTRPVAR